MAEMTVFVKELKRAITGRETGSNKQTASKSCALSIIRQMYHLKVIEAFSGSIRVKALVFQLYIWKIGIIYSNIVFVIRSEDQMDPYPVRISPALMDRLELCLNDLNISPVVPNQLKEEANGAGNQLQSLLVCHRLSNFIHV